jgi:hypothetical protein
MMCSPDEVTESDVILLTENVEKFNKCVKGKRYRYECNDCECMDDGKLVCTRQSCGDKRKRSADDDIIQVTGDFATYQCEENKKYRYKCNDCRCIKGGLACTRKVCGPGETRRKREDQKPKPKIGDPDYTCVPGTTFMDDEGCNSCFCAANGKDVGCTDMACDRIPQKREAVDPSSPDYTCEADSVFQWECNSCKCSKNGKGAACTRRVCAPGHKQEKRAVKEECKEGDTKTHHCNACTCENNLWICTKKSCVTKPISKRDVEY